MICVLKHKKSGKYIAGAIGVITQGPEFKPTQWNGDTSTIQFHVTDNLLKAKQIEDPDMDMVLAFGLEPIPIKLKKAVLKQDYRIIEHV